MCGFRVILQASSDTKGAQCQPLSLLTHSSRALLQIGTMKTDHGGQWRAHALVQHQCLTIRCCPCQSMLPQQNGLQITSALSRCQTVQPLRDPSQADRDAGLEVLPHLNEQLCDEAGQCRLRRYPCQHPCAQIDADEGQVGHPSYGHPMSSREQL